MSAGLRRSFSSLAVPNYRRYFTGQVISISGNWMQTVAEMWLMVQLTGSGLSVGITAGLQFLPILLFGALGGVLADRREVAHRDELRLPLLMMAVVGTLSFNFQVLLPLFARFTWHGTASAYALLTSAMGIGSVAGALAAGARNRVSPALLVGSSAVFGAASLAAAAAPTLPLQVAALVPLGAASVTFAAGVNSSLQLAAGPALRGRVMALYSVVLLGSTPIGAPLVGWLAGAAGPRTGLLLGGVAALLAAAGARAAFERADAWPAAA